MLLKLLKKAFAVMLLFASRRTTELAPDDVVTPVPPLATGNAVPEYDSVNVPDVVTGDPVTVNIAGADNATLVTVPEPPPPLYWGILSVLPINVAAPLDPVVVSVMGA
jgi:hypothetical protein